MGPHICLLFDGEDAIIKSSTILTARTPAEAQTKAQALLEQTPGAAGFELWLNGDRVFIHFPSRNKSAQN